MNSKNIKHKNKKSNSPSIYGLKFNIKDIRLNPRESKMWAEAFFGTPKKKQDNKDGCTCEKCKNFFPMAEPNQEDGTLICYACRNGL